MLKRKNVVKIANVIIIKNEGKNNLLFRIDGAPRLLIIPFLATLPNLIHLSPFINFGEFCQPHLLFQTPHLLIHVHCRQR